MDAYDINMFRITHWTSRALHMVAAKTLSFLRRLNVFTPWHHRFTFNVTMWFVVRWWHEVETRHRWNRVANCGVQGGMCRVPHMCEWHRRRFREKFQIVNLCKRCPIPLLTCTDYAHYKQLLAIMREVQEQERIFDRFWFSFNQLSRKSKSHDL